MAKYEARTRVDRQSVADFLDGVAPLKRQAEARQLVRIFTEVTGWQPRLYTGGMVGFGSYAYSYASGHSGTSMATGFAPRRAELSVYVLDGSAKAAALLPRLGPHRAGKACLYIRHLDRIDEAVLRELIAAGLEGLQKAWPVTET